LPKAVIGDFQLLIKVGIRLPNAIEEVAARDALDAEEPEQEADHA